MVFAGVFPLFGFKLFERLGIDWGVALLAFLNLGVGVVVIPVVRFPISPVASIQF
jgi:hypothetical protein